MLLPGALPRKPFPVTWRAIRLRSIKEQRIDRWEEFWRACASSISVAISPGRLRALLAEFGAEVIRVEKRDGSEDRFVAPVSEGGEGALFLQVNRNKKCITLDPMKPEEQEVMRRLVATADVVVANLPPNAARDEARL